MRIGEKTVVQKLNPSNDRTKVEEWEEFDSEPQTSRRRILVGRRGNKPRTEDSAANSDATTRR